MVRSAFTRRPPPPSTSTPFVTATSLRDLFRGKKRVKVPRPSRREGETRLDTRHGDVSDLPVLDTHTPSTATVTEPPCDPSLDAPSSTTRQSATFPLHSPSSIPLSSSRSAPPQRGLPALPGSPESCFLPPASPPLPVALDDDSELDPTVSSLNGQSLSPALSDYSFVDPDIAMPSDPYHPGSMASSSSMPHSSTGRGKPPPPTGMALGLEEEVDFGSDEDLMENVGEIQLPPSKNVWYPGKPDSPPSTPSKNKGKEKMSTPSSVQSKSSKSSRPSLLGKIRADKARGRGLGDAKVLVPDNFNDSVGDLLGHHRQTSGGSQVSLSTSKSGSQSGSAKKEKRTVLGKVFGRRGTSEASSPASAPGSRLANNSMASMESFGSYAKSETSSHSQPKSILVTPAQSSNDPSVQSAGSVPDLPPVATSPFIYDPTKTLPRSRSGLSQTSQPGDTQAQGDYISATPYDQSLQPPGSPSPAGSRSAERLALPSGSPRSQASAGISAFPLPPVPTLGPRIRAPSPAAVDPSDLVHFLLPSFPCHPSALESTTILSTTVLRRMGPSSSAPDSKLSKFRPSTSGSIAATFGRSRPIWQSHKLVLTSLRINEASPQPSPTPDGYDYRRQRQPSGTQTVAHLHLFATPVQTKGSMPKKRPNTANTANTAEISPVQIDVVEVGRKRLSALSDAGVWDGKDTDDNKERIRKWVLRIGFEQSSEEWICDMPTYEALHEWIKQIKGHATVIKAEGLGFGAAIRKVHASGANIDLSLELDMHSKGLKATPRYKAPLPPRSLQNDDPFIATAPTAHEYRQQVLSRGLEVHPQAVEAVPSETGLIIDTQEKGVISHDNDAKADRDWANKQASGHIRPRHSASSTDDEVIDAMRTLHVTTQDGLRRATSLDIRREKFPAGDLQRSLSKSAKHLPPLPPAPTSMPPPAPPPAGLPPPVPPPTGLPPPVPPPSHTLPPLPSLPLRQNVVHRDIFADDGVSPTIPTFDTPPPAPTLARSPEIASPFSDPPNRAESWRDTLSAPSMFKPLSLAPELFSSSSPYSSRSNGSDTASSRPQSQSAQYSTSERQESPFYTPAEDIAGSDAFDLHAIHEQPVVHKEQGFLSSLAPLNRYDADNASTISGGSSSVGGRRRNRPRVPAVDLMAELSGRPEMNFEPRIGHPEDEQIQVDEDRPRRIRFAG